MKDKLKNIFQNSYPGIDIFISDVLTPIFSEDFIEGKNVNLIVSEEIKKRANNANIQSAFHVADIDRIDSDPIAVYDVTLKANSKITHSRVAIKQFITALSMTYTHVFIVFHYENEPDRPWRFSYVYKESTIAGTHVTAKRYTYVFGKDYRSRTAVDRFVKLANSPKTDDDFAKAFSVEALSDEFFIKYRERYADFVQYITGKSYVKENNKWVERTEYEPNAQYYSTFGGDDKLVRDYIKKMFGRIVFLYFLQRKGWLAKNKQYMHDLYYNSKHKDNFLDEVLEPLFFEVLNTDKQYRTTEAKKLPNSDEIPYLNGGLFARDEIDELQCVFQKKYFEQLFDFLDSYNFTIDENDPNDAEVGVDPEMLGKIFENLLEDNKDKGAFYTPKEIVRYMCQESLIAYLETNTSIAKDKIRQFVLSPEEGVANISDNKKPKLLAALEEVKICDPAIGSGAFPMGLLNELLHCREVLSGEHYDRAEIKKSIIQNNIYGVDIEKGAVDIARLRFWLSIVVDEETPSPLPNLDYKIMQGNSLIESFMGVDLSGLTYERQSKHDSGAGSLFDDEKNRLQKVVSDLLREYYSCSDHDSKIRLQQRITDTINKQLEAQAYDPTILAKLKGINLAENNKFFLWHTWFSDVFNRDDKEGFDIVIGNPPYVSTKGVTVEDKSKYEAEFGFSDDTYNLFFFKGIQLCTTGGCLTYITPKTFWTTQTKRNLRDLLLSKTINYIFDTGNPFLTAMVDTCITSICNRKCHENDIVKFIDGSTCLSNPECLYVNQSVFSNTQNSVIFKPNELNMRIFNLYGSKVKELYDTWWEKIKTSRDIEKNKGELQAYRNSLKPGDIALLGCLTEGGQGLATANNGKYIAVRKSTKWADKIIESRPKKLAEARRKKKINIPELNNFSSENEFLNSLNESEIVEGFCWSDINTTFLKCRKKQKSIHDVKSMSMSMFGVADVINEDYIITLINSTLISYYIDNMVNNTQTFQINDARQLPIIIPSSED